MADDMRIDVVSDTHGYLAPELLSALEGADLIVHAGDITSELDWEELRCIAPIKAVLGNNDWHYDYGPEVERLARFEYGGLEFAVAHYREDLPIGSVDVAVCGHSHRAKIERVGRTTVVNPGSASYPRGGAGPTIARLMLGEGFLRSAEIVEL